jgi:hypothetical protein
VPTVLATINTGYEGCRVDKITPKLVYVISPNGWQRFTLKRRALEKWGWTINRPTGGVYYTEMPEEYQKKTLGYILRADERELLGLPVDFTPDQLRDAYRAAVKKHHPDAGGDPTMFRRIKEAHEKLVNSPTLGEMLRTILRETKD